MSAASLAIVRVVFGSVGVLSAVRLLGHGWVDTLYSDARNHLAYPAMSWIPVLSPELMRVQVAVMGAAAALVAIGWHHRFALAVFLVAFTWLEFTEASVYLNHYWFVTLMGLVLVALPADVSMTSRAPMAAVWLVRAQVGVVYVFAGLAKLNGDWLLRGLPLELWLPARAGTPLIGWIAALPHAALVLSWLGALFDCAVVPLLLWRRTRLAAWSVVVSFHVVTWLFFPMIGVFPWLMIGASTVFFDPDWPLRLRARLRLPVPAATAGPVRPLRRRWLVIGCVWLAVQVALPLRHLAYPGDHRWTGEGYRFGWNVLLTEKAGDVTFEVTDTRAGTSWETTGRDLFTVQQWRVMVNDPELIRQAAHVVAAEARESHPDGIIEVRVRAYVSMNGRAAELVIDPTVDLAAEPWRLGGQRWIRPAR